MLLCFPLSCLPCSIGRWSIEIDFSAASISACFTPLATRRWFGHGAVQGALHCAEIDKAAGRQRGMEAEMRSEEEVSMANIPSMVLDWTLFLRVARSCWLSRRNDIDNVFCALVVQQTGVEWHWQRGAGRGDGDMPACGWRLRLVMELQPSSTTISSGTSTVETMKVARESAPDIPRFAIKKILRMIFASHGLDKISSSDGSISSKR